MVAIKDMEMPKSCWNCNFCCDKNGYYCGISYNPLARKVVDIPSENRPTDCPLTEIVTCADCVYGVFGECKKFHHYTTKDDFCNFGERRD